MRRACIAILLAVLALAMIVPSTVVASGWDGSIKWKGQGKDEPGCGSPDHECTEAGWIHWVVTQADGVTEAEIVLGGSGTGGYNKWNKDPGKTLHLFTPYYDVDTLEATMWYKGVLGKNTQFVISDYCPGIKERLTVSKTAVTSYTRTHFWDIAKSVSTENGYTHDELPKVWLWVDCSGDETATWTVDVAYKGCEDSGHKVSGVITIENTGTLDAEITEIVDVLGGKPISVVCPVELPYTLKKGETLTCTYSEDGKITGNNEVTVTTGSGRTYTAEAEVVWGDPTKEVNKTVTIEDVSDLFGEQTLGTVTAPDSETFTYTKDFAWVDYGVGVTRDFVYNNTATIVETGQSASATLKVNVQGYIYETAYAKGDSAIPFIPKFSNWGWTNPIVPWTYTWDLWAGAAQCDPSKGTLVGSVTVVYGADGNVTVTYDVFSPNILKETHVYAGTEMFPSVRQGKVSVPTVAPGQYTNASPFNSKPMVYVIAHAKVGIPDPNFGP